MHAQHEFHGHKSPLLIEQVRPLYLAVVVVHQSKRRRGADPGQGHCQVSADPAAFVMRLGHEAMPEQRPPHSCRGLGHDAVDGPCVVPLPMLQHLHMDS